MKKNNNKKPENGFSERFLYRLFVGTAITLSLWYVFWYNGNLDNGSGSFSNVTIELPYSDFAKHLSAGTIKSLIVEPNNGIAKGLIYPQGGDETKAIKFKVSVPNNEAFWKKIDESNVPYKLSHETQSSQSSLFYWLLLILVFLILLFLIYQVVSFIRGLGSGNGSTSSRNIFGGFGKNRARFYPAGTVGVKFDDVAGANEVKDELIDIVEFLKNPERFNRLGAKIPRGVLLCGSPGNGKTLLAKAVAGEANCPFFSINGSDFVEMFVGVGASRVRDLFKEARRNSPAIVFIDEIDAVGRQRGSSNGGGNDEREQTLNQLLAELDGFDTEPGEIIVLAATNRKDVLDSALTRPGRFDRTVTVPSPDIVTRELILRIHARNIKLAQDIDLKVLAKATTGLSGADLANLLNEAALLASKEGRAEVLQSDIDHARDRGIMGSKNKTLIRTDSDRLCTAYHEAGHALCRILLPSPNHFLYKVTILSRGGSLGSTHYTPESDEVDRTIESMEHDVCVSLGGMAAEQLVYGTHGVGVSSDLRSANSVARGMVESVGMSKLGAMTFNSDCSGGSRYSQAYLEKVDSEVSRIISDCYKKSTTVLSENRDLLEKLAKALVEKETMSAEEVYDLLGITKPEVQDRIPRA